MSPKSRWTSLLLGHSHDYDWNISSRWVTDPKHYGWFMTPGYFPWVNDNDLGERMPSGIYFELVLPGSLCPGQGRRSSQLGQGATAFLFWAKNPGHIPWVDGLFFFLNSVPAAVLTGPISLKIFQVRAFSPGSCPPLNSLGRYLGYFPRGQCPPFNFLWSIPRTFLRDQCPRVQFPWVNTLNIFPRGHWGRRPRPFNFLSQYLEHFFLLKLLWLSSIRY
jgi:hypothetical protein